MRRSVSSVAASHGWRLSIVLVGLVSALACGNRHDGIIRQPSTGGPIRLVDVLPLAHVEPPLETVETDASEPSIEPIWSWNAEDDEGIDLGGDRCRRTVSNDGVAELSCSPDSILWARVPTATAGVYRFRIHAGSMRNAECYFLAVHDREGSRIGSRLDQLETGEGVYEVESHFGSAAPQAVLVLRGRRQVPVAGCELEIRSIEVDRPDLEPVSLLARIRESHELAGSRHPLAIAGYLLPPPTAETASAPLDVNHSSREAILALPPRRLVFPLEVPAEARLSISLGLHRLSAPGSRTRFSVHIQEDDELTTLHDEDLAALEEEWHWRDRRLDLAAWSGRRVDLVLETVQQGDGVAIPVWGAPRIDFPRSRADPPSVLLLAVDTLRADRLGPYGSDDPPTPALCALAEEGVVFERAIAPSNWTLPSFASLLTGVSPARHGVLRVLDALPSHLDTLAEQFRTEGWITEAILYKPPLAAGRDLERGFEHYFNVPRVHVRGDQNRRKALEWLEDHGDRRFFLFLHFDDPHLPYTQPERWIPQETREALARLEVVGLADAQSGHKLRKACELCVDDPEARTAFEAATRSLYDSEVAYVDDQIRGVFDRLRQLGLWDELLVIFLSDHGELLWEPAAPGRNPRYGHGGEAHPDSLVHVPLIIKSPASWEVQPGTRVQRPVSLVDVAATLAELAGGDSVPDGQSLLGLLRGDSPDSLPDRPMLSVGRIGESLRWGPWHYSRGYEDPEVIREWVERIESESAAVEPDNVPLAELRARMADHVVDAGAGLIVLALRTLPGQHLTLSLGGDESCVDARRQAFVPYGLTWHCRDGRWQADGRSDTTLPVVFGLFAESDGRFAVEATLDGLPFARRRFVFESLDEYRPGQLVDWLTEAAEPAMMLARVAGPSEAEERLVIADVDEDQLEALRALGYIE